MIIRLERGKRFTLLCFTHDFSLILLVRQMQANLASGKGRALTPRGRMFNISLFASQKGGKMKKILNKIVPGTRNLNTSCWSEILTSSPLVKSLPVLATITMLIWKAISKPN